MALFLDKLRNAVFLGQGHIRCFKKTRATVIKPPALVFPMFSCLRNFS